LPKNKRLLVVDHVKRNKLHYGLLLTTTGGTSCVYYYSHLEITPITNRERFMLFTNEQLKEIEKLERESVNLKKKKIIIS
jgi:hypothetical protein